MMLETWRESKAKGYIETRKGGILHRIHVLVYEAAHGKVPKGYVVHHIDGNKHNNNLRNLERLEWGEHSAIHGFDWTQIGTKWHKTCIRCKRQLEIERFAKNNSKLRSYC